MEGAGGAEAIVNYTKVVLFTIIRGIADRLDQRKGDSRLKVARVSANAVATPFAEVFADYKNQ
jgi:hypothetical protein